MLHFMQQSIVTADLTRGMLYLVQDFGYSIRKVHGGVATPCLKQHKITRFRRSLNGWRNRVIVIAESLRH